MVNELPSTTKSKTLSSKVIIISNTPSPALSCHRWGASFTEVFLFSIGSNPFLLYLDGSPQKSTESRAFQVIVQGARQGNVSTQRNGKATPQASLQTQFGKCANNFSPGDRDIASNDPKLQKTIMVVICFHQMHAKFRQNSIHNPKHWSTSSPPNQQRWGWEKKEHQEAIGGSLGGEREDDSRCSYWQFGVLAAEVVVDGAVGGAEVVDVGLVEGGAGELDVGARAVGLDVEPRAAQLRVRLHAPVHVRGADHREPPPLSLGHRPVPVLRRPRTSPSARGRALCRPDLLAAAASGRMWYALGFVRGKRADGMILTRGLWDLPAGWVFSFFHASKFHTLNYHS